MSARHRFATFARKPTRAENRAAAIAWAYGCRPEKLAEITAEEFAKRHGMELPDAAALLAEARADRNLST